MYEQNGFSVYEDVGEILRTGRLGLLVIDMQNDVVSSNGAYASAGDNVQVFQEIVPTIARIVEAARISEIPVCFTQNTTLPGGLSDSSAWIYFKTRARPTLAGAYTIKGSWGHEILPELSPLESELVVEKFRSDAFEGTALASQLRAAEIDSLLIVGVVTHGCVEATARRAAFLDFHPVIIGDATAAGSPDLQESALSLLSKRLDVIESDALLSALEERRESP